MAKLDWGDTDGEMLHMVRATLQTHENLLVGSTEEKIDGVVPTVTNLMTTIKAYRSLGLALNALIVILLGIMEYRAETKPPIVIYQQAPTPAQHKGHNEYPSARAEQPPQESTNPTQGLDQ